jgi:hypothetical protein
MFWEQRIQTDSMDRIGKIRHGCKLRRDKEKSASWAGEKSDKK